jgi:hypothetical protein
LTHLLLVVKFMPRPLDELAIDSGHSGVMEMSRQLPMAAYHATERWNAERIGALALYCSDGRWGEAFDEFCHSHLQIPRYDRWAVPGGPAWIAAPHDADILKAARIQLDFLVRAHELERIVLITHFGCAWYGERLKQSPDDCLPSQTADMVKAAGVLHTWYPGLVVETYLAMRSNESLSFHRLESPSGRGLGASGS